MTKPPSSSGLINKYKQEHQELYQKLESYLLDLTKVKVDRDDEHLIKTCTEVLAYIKEILENHFKEEERDLFPEYQKEKPELIERLLSDHQEIEDKYLNLQKQFQDFTDNPKREELDYKTMLLFPAYNLIATINHHAQREDLAWS